MPRLRNLALDPSHLLGCSTPWPRINKGDDDEEDGDDDDNGVPYLRCTCTCAHLNLPNPSNPVRCAGVIIPILEVRKSRLREGSDLSKVTQ